MSQDVIEVPVLIARKRDGGALDAAETTAFVAGYVDGRVSEPQMAAYLMAGVLTGFTDEEAAALTTAYVESGDVIDLSALSGPTVDKHSTGGVGDTTTLVVAPLLAAAGAQVAKLSGRGLGHTGGTLDKLEAIPGYRVDLDIDEVRDQVEQIGVAVAAATAALVPADKRIYALRDVTATVASEALIAASVMSKKLAGGADSIVLDVKVGDGAFMRTVEEARALAERCVAVGEQHGRRTIALLTAMDQPLGTAVGNALEVAAAVAVLRGEGDARLRTVSLELAAAGVRTAGLDDDPAAAMDTVTRLLDDGTALERFEQWVEAQGGDPRVATAPDEVLAAAPVVRPWTARGGVLTGVDTRRLGELAGLLGAGRQAPGDELDPRVGLIVRADVGDEVGDGPTVEIHAADEDAAARVAGELGAVMHVDGDGGTTMGELVIERVTGRSG